MSFVHTAILGGLALASLPIIIHLLNRRRFKTMEWAAMDFLLKAAVRNRRRVRLENLLLLLLRTAIVALLVLAVARPFTKREHALAGLFGAEGSTERIVLLDDSHSMRAGQGNQSAFDTAKQLLKKLVTRLYDERSSDRLTIVLGSRPRQVEAGFAHVTAASAQSQRVLQGLDSLRPCDGVLDVAGAVDAILESQEDEGARLVLHVVSDFRRKDWTDADGSLRPEILEAFRRFAERGEIRLLDVGSNPVQNVGITDLAPRERAVVAGVPATFVATIRNHGPEPATVDSVVFRFGDHVAAPERVEGVLQPGEEAQVTKEFHFRGEGPVVVSAELRTDVLPGDDIRRRVVHVRKRMRFLLVDGEPQLEDFRGETDFLAAALAPPGEVSSGIEVDPVAEQAFSGRELEAYDGVFLCNVYRLPDDRVARLEEFVRGGGGLVFFLGDQVDPQIYNATFFGTGDEAGARLLPLYLLETEGSSESYVHFAPPAADHPLVRFLRGLNEVVFRTVAVRRYIGARVAATQEGTRVILSYSDEAGAPAIAEKSFGDGRVLLFTTAADTEWSNFPNSILYVALMQEAARYVVRPDDESQTLLVSSPLETTFDPTLMQRLALVVPPAELGGAPVQLPLNEDPDTKRLFFRYGRTHGAGVYTLRLKSPEGESYERPYVFNVDPAEGDLRRADLSRVADALPGVRIERAGEEAALDTDESDRAEFWRTLLYALIACAALETILAWRFGHHGRRKIATEGKQVFVR